MNFTWIHKSFPREPRYLIIEVSWLSRTFSAKVLNALCPGFNFTNTVSLAYARETY